MDEFKSGVYLLADCTWTLEHDTHGDSNVNKQNALRILIDPNGRGDTRYLNFARENGHLLLWNYYGDPDSWEFMEYARVGDVTSNNGVNLTGRPVTALANNASTVPARPAGYAGRSADNDMSDALNQINRGFLNVFASVGVVLLITVIPQAADARALRASEVSRMIDTDGPQATLRRLVADEVTEQLFDGIASGEKAWLRIAEQLRPVSDGANGESLIMAIQEALAKDPTAILQLVQKGVFAVGEACGEYGFGQIEDERPTDVILALIDLRVRKVTAIHSPSLRREREACLRELAQLRKATASQ